MNISRVSNAEMERISKIVPKQEEPKAPPISCGYGFEQVLRKEQKRLGVKDANKTI